MPSTARGQRSSSISSASQQPSVSDTYVAHKPPSSTTSRRWGGTQHDRLNGTCLRQRVSAGTHG
eukprot:1311607-Pyramimonas_sp.AAC.1